MLRLPECDRVNATMLRLDEVGISISTKIGEQFVEKVTQKRKELFISTFVYVILM